MAITHTIRDITKNEEKLLNEIMDWYDFSKVAKCMSLLKWKWASIDVEHNNGIPTEPEIREKARKMIIDLLKYPNFEKSQLKFCATGGLQVSIHLDGYNFETESIELKFVVAELYAVNYLL